MKYRVQIEMTIEAESAVHARREVEDRVRLKAREWRPGEIDWRWKVTREIQEER